MGNEELVIRIKNREDTAENMNQLWQQNKAFIHLLALKYAAYEEIEDLEQEGFIGLCNAVDGYRADAGIPFLNYAAFWIRQAMVRYIENCGSCVRIPSHMNSKIKEYKRIQALYRQYYGRIPDDREMQNLLNISCEQLKSIQHGLNMKYVDSLNREINSKDEGEICCLGDNLANNENIEIQVLNRIEAEELKSAVWSLVDGLPDMQAAVIRMRYMEGKSLKESGQKIGLKAEKARRLEQKALRELRMPGRREVLIEFLPEEIGSMAYYGSGVGTFNRTWTSSTERAALWLEV